MAFSKINNLFMTLNEFCVKNEDETAWTWVEEKFMVGGVRANVCRAVRAYKAELAEAQNEIITTETGDIVAEERALLQFDWCDNFLAHIGRGPEDAMVAPVLKLREMLHEVDRSLFVPPRELCEFVRSSAEFRALFPSAPDMAVVNPDLREALDVLAMMDGKDAGGMERFVAVSCVIRNANLLWSANGTEWFAVFETPTQWGEWLNRTEAAEGVQTFAERAVEQMRERHERVVVGTNVRCVLRWLEGSKRGQVDMATTTTEEEVVSGKRKHEERVEVNTSYWLPVREFETIDDAILWVDGEGMRGNFVLTHMRVVSRDGFMLTSDGVSVPRTDA